MVDSDQIKNWIAAGLECQVTVEGDGHHFDAVIVCDAFEGENTLTRHRMVYETLGDRMGGDIHALSLRTYTSSEYSDLD